jgi:hypothetical protein
MLTWIANIALAYLIAAKITNWPAKVGLALLAGIATSMASMTLALISNPNGDPLAEVDRLIFGAIVNFIICLVLVALFGWQRQRVSKRKDF